VIKRLEVGEAIVLTKLPTARVQQVAVRRPASPGRPCLAGPGRDQPAGPGRDHPAGPGRDHPAGPGRDHPAGPGRDYPAPGVTR
jgi:hypothetical protein